jgi:heat shock protein HtpX
MTKTAGGKPPSLAGRFAAAIALTIGFYILALAIALALIGVPVYAWVSGGSFNIWLTIFGLFTGGSILVAIVPRRTPFTPPGPRIDPSGQPRLMAAVEQVAQATGQEPPAETYATLEVNAGVTEISNGFLRGRRRILIFGCRCCTS